MPRNPPGLNAALAEMAEKTRREHLRRSRAAHELAAKAARTAQPGSLPSGTELKWMLAHQAEMEKAAEWKKRVDRLQPGGSRAPLHARITKQGALQRHQVVYDPKTRTYREPIRGVDYR